MEHGCKKRERERIKLENKKNYILKGKIIIQVKSEIIYFF